MSIKVMDWAWREAPVKGSALLLLLAIADHANEDGTGAWPSVETLAAKVRLSVRNVQYLLRHLEQKRCIETLPNAGPAGANVYTVIMGGQSLPGEADFRGVQPVAGVQSLQGARGANQRQKGVQPVAPKPSLEPSYVSSTATTARAREATQPGNPAIFALFEDLTGRPVPSAILAEELQEAEREHTPECIARVFREAAANEARSWAYCGAIFAGHESGHCAAAASRRRPAKAGPRTAGARSGRAVPAGGPDLEAGRRFLAGQL